jgi:hypothetical protein
MRVWDCLHRAWLWGRKANDHRTREPVERGTTLDGETDPVVEHRRRFWDEFREGQRQANARCDADRISDVAEPGG